MFSEVIEDAIQMLKYPFQHKKTCTRYFSITCGNCRAPPGEECRKGCTWNYADLRKCNCFPPRAKGYTGGRK